MEEAEIEQLNKYVDQDLHENSKAENEVKSQSKENEEKKTPAIYKGDPRMASDINEVAFYGKKLLHGKPRYDPATEESARLSARTKEIS